MTKASDNQFPSILAVNTSNASIANASPWNAQRLFFDNDGTLKRKDSSGNVNAVEGGGSITFGGVSSTDTVTVASNFSVSDQGGGTARLDVFFPGGGGSSSFIGARVSKSGAQSINSATLTEVSWDTESIDTNTLHDTSTNNGRITVHTGGKWDFGVFIRLDGLSNGKYLDGELYLGGSGGTRLVQEYHHQNATGIPATVNMTTGPVTMTTSQYVNAYVYHDHGSALNVNAISYFWAKYLGS